MTTSDGLIASLLPKQPRSEPLIRTPGRPRQWTAARYQALIGEYKQAHADFIRQHGREPVSDIELLTVMAANAFREHGMRVARVNDPGLQSRLKTLRNRLSEARRLT